MQMILDEHKTEMPEGVYLSLCNVAKGLHESTEDIYVVQYYEYGYDRTKHNIMMNTCIERTSIMRRGKPADTSNDILGERHACVQFRDYHVLPLNEDGTVPTAGTAFEMVDSADLDSIVVIQGCYPLHSVEGEQAMERFRQDH